MLNILWPCIIIISTIYALIVGKISVINESMYKAAADSIQLLIRLLGSICVWNGFLKILEETSLQIKLEEIMRPIIKFLFPNLKKENSAYNSIAENICANFLGIGNVATPLGLKAVNELDKQRINGEYISKEMAVFIVLNTASIQLIPTTVISIRASLGANNPNEIIIPVIISTLISNIVGIITIKILFRKKDK